MSGMEISLAPVVSTAVCSKTVWFRCFCYINVVVAPIVCYKGIVVCPFCCVASLQVFQSFLYGEVALHKLSV